MKRVYQSLTMHIWFSGITNYFILEKMLNGALRVQYKNIKLENCSINNKKNFYFQNGSLSFKKFEHEIDTCINSKNVKCI